MSNEVSSTIWLFIKFFKKERHADAFMRGELYLNTLGYFRNVEAEEDDGRADRTEAVAKWLQPHDVIMTLKAPGIEEAVISGKDLAGPISFAYSRYDSLHLLCLYAIYTTGFVAVNGKFDVPPEKVEEFRRQVTIDAQCQTFGEYAVVVRAVPFLDQLREALANQGCKYNGRLVEYYDEETFHGEIPDADIPFRKQKRFAYQREFRVCVQPSKPQDGAISISIGDLSEISRKVKSSELSGLCIAKEE